MDPSTKGSQEGMAIIAILHQGRRCRDDHQGLVRGLESSSSDSRDAHSKEVDAGKDQTPFRDKAMPKKLKPSQNLTQQKNGGVPKKGT
jgi:hypothetical protein